MPSGSGEASENVSGIGPKSNQDFDRDQESGGAGLTALNPPASSMVKSNHEVVEGGRRRRLRLMENKNMCRL